MHSQGALHRDAEVAVEGLKYDIDGLAAESGSASRATRAR